jgi:hypothetical protein
VAGENCQFRPLFVAAHALRPSLPATRANKASDIAVRQNRTHAFDLRTAIGALSWAMLDPSQGLARAGYGLSALHSKKF